MKFIPILILAVTVCFAQVEMRIRILNIDNGEVQEDLDLSDDSVEAYAWMKHIVAEFADSDKVRAVSSPYVPYIREVEGIPIILLEHFEVTEGPLESAIVQRLIYIYTFDDVEISDMDTISDSLHAFMHHEIPMIPSDFKMMTTNEAVENNNRQIEMVMDGPSPIRTLGNIYTLISYPFDEYSTPQVIDAKLILSH